MFRFSLVVALAALVVPTVAAAKGPSEGSIARPRFARTVEVLEDGGGGSPGATLSQVSGFFPASYGQEPDPLLHRRPSGSLGPRYTILWKVPSGGGETYRIRQDLYPYARGGAVSYTRPGQPISGTTTRGRWYRGSGLKRTLVSLGLPARAPGGSGGTSWALVTGLTLAGVCALAAPVLWRRQRGQRSPSTSSTEFPAGSRT